MKALDSLIKKINKQVVSDRALGYLEVISGKRRLLIFNRNTNQIIRYLTPVGTEKHLIAYLKKSFPEVK